jgi:hypothetical protein
MQPGEAPVKIGSSTSLGTGLNLPINCRSIRGRLAVHVAFQGLMSPDTAEGTQGPTLVLEV